MWIRSLDGEDPLEKEMTTYSRILAWEIPWQRSLVGHSSWGHKAVRHNLAAKQGQKQTLRSQHGSFHCISKYELPQIVLFFNIISVSLKTNCPDYSTCNHRPCRMLQVRIPLISWFLVRLRDLMEILATSAGISVFITGFSYKMTSGHISKYKWKKIFNRIIPL